MDEWKQVIQKFANGRPICNCGMAYYSTGGEYMKNFVVYHDGLYCKSGCSANQLDAMDYIAKCILENQS